MVPDPRRAAARRTKKNHGHAKPRQAASEKGSYRYECYREAWGLLTKSRSELSQCGLKIKAEKCVATYNAGQGIQRRCHNNYTQALQWFSPKSMVIDVSPEEFEQLKPIFLHESGHAIMAVLKDLPCSGIFLHSASDGAEFCCVATLHEPLTRGDYLQAAAGVAAELIFYEKFDASRSDSDRQVFEKPGAPPWDEMVEEARVILAAKRERLQILASLVEDKVANTADGSMLKTQHLFGHSGVFRELVTGDTVYHVTTRDTPSS